MIEWTRAKGIVIACLMAFSATPIQAVVVVSNIAEPERSLDDIDASLWSAQSFETNSESAVLTRVTAIVGGETGASGAFAELRAATATGEMDTSPAGLVSILSLPDLSGPRRERPLIPLSPVILAPDTRYFVFMGATGPGSFEWSYAEGNGQIGVGAFTAYEHSFDGGAFWSVFGTDNPFHLRVDAEPAEPEVLVSNLAEPVRDVDEISPVLWSTQSFETDGQSYLLTDIGALVGGESGASGAFAELRSATPTGSMDTSAGGLIAALTLPDLSGPRSERLFVPASPVLLAPNTRYYVLMGANGPGFFEWSYAEGNGQIGVGTLTAFEHSFDSGATWPVAGVENPLHLQARAVPEPGVGLMLVAGSLATATWRRSELLRRKRVSPRMRFRPRPAVTMAVMSVVVALITRSAIAGPTFVVNSLADVPAGAITNDGVCETATGNGVCTLRAAIMEANAVPDSIVRLPAGFYPLTRGTLSVLSPMKIEGDGPSISVVDGINLARVFDVAHTPVAEPVEIRALTVQRGIGSGGGIRVRSPLLLENANIKDNSGGLGPGLYVESSFTMRHGIVTGNASTVGDGGGVYVTSPGSARIEDSRIERNAAFPTGGGIFVGPGSSVRLERTSVALNRAGTTSTSSLQMGGGIETRGDLVVLNSLIWGNGSFWEGGGIHANGGSTQLLNVTLTNNSGFDSTVASPPGGAISVASGTSFSLTRSIVTSNKSECLGSIFSGDHNVVRSPATCPLFGLLTHNFNATGWDTVSFNGGFSPEVSSLSTPAEGTVPAASCLDDLGAPLLTDIRGHRRKPPACDRGAHDAQAIYTPVQLLGLNLVRNGGRVGEELGLAEVVANPTNVDLYQAPYWSQEGRMVQLQYGAPDGYPALGDAPPDSGHKFFAGGVDPITNASQFLDVSALAAQIDAGEVTYDASGAFGGYFTDDDRATLVVQFSNASGFLEALTLGGFSAADRGNQTRLIADQRVGVLPVGTRTIELYLTFQRFAGFANDGYADAISLTLPEPGTAASLAAGLSVLVVLARRGSRPLRPADGSVRCWKSPNDRETHRPSPAAAANGEMRRA